MKQLVNVLANVNVIKIFGDQDISISGIQSDSRLVSDQNVFVAIKGMQVDGHDYIPKAISQGAKVILCEVLPDELSEQITYVQLRSTQKSLGIIAANYFDNPSRGMQVVGITGTNGKTTIATLLFNLFRSMGYKAALLSTVENRIMDDVIPATHTTPDAIAMQALMSDCRDAGCAYVFMEVSSHAIDQDRIAGLEFAAGVFSNITRDHLDYHQTFKAYRDAKKRFFDHLPKGAFALTNADDKNGKVMLQNTKAKKLYYSLLSLHDYKAKVLQNDLTGMLLNINGTEIYSRLVGDFNAYNVLAVYGVADQLGLDQNELRLAVSNLNTAEGRFDIVNSPSGMKGIVDYAHTPDALLNVLKTIRNIHKKGKLVTVVGCGGDRDKGKRPQMTRIAADYSDLVIVTSDNPRSEDPNQIITDMMEGLSKEQKKNILTNPDREQAIKNAVMLSDSNSVILVAGKGHEKYQITKGVKTPFDDKQILKAFMQEDI